MQKQTPRKTYAFVGDGETEQWYLQMLKKNETNLTVTIKPELPQDKSIEDQFAYVQELSAVHDKVFWMVDLDVIIRDTKAFKGPKDKTPAAVLKTKYRLLRTDPNLKRRLSSLPIRHVWSTGSSFTWSRLPNITTPATR